MSERLRRRASRAFASAPLTMAWCVGRYLSHRMAMPERLASSDLEAVLEGLEHERSPGWVGAVSAAQYVDAVETAEAILTRMPKRPASTCLYRSLARYALGREVGFRPTFVIGVAPDAAHRTGDEIGHAWVELEGIPVPMERLPQHIVSYAHPARSA